MLDYGTMSLNNNCCNMLKAYYVLGTVINILHI